MVTESKHSGEKKLRVVFENKHSGSHFFNDEDHIEDNAKPENEYTKTAVIEKKYAEIMDPKFDDIWVELQMPREMQYRRLRDITMAVKQANQRVNLGTDKFLQDVESMVTVFKTELDKMEELCGNILKKFPGVPNVSRPINVLSSV